jgi:hypothetical protein
LFLETSSPLIWATVFRILFPGYVLSISIPFSTVKPLPQSISYRDIRVYKELRRTNCANRLATEITVPVLTGFKEYMVILAGPSFVALATWIL